jgi:electron transport complex protein RnfE
MRFWRELTKGLVRENPIFVIVLGLCPTLAVTTSVSNAVGMGAAVIFVLACSNAIISSCRRFFAAQIRIPCYIIVVSTFVTIVHKVMQAWAPDLNEAMGIFIPLIVVNCIILGRAEAFAGRNPVLPSLADGLGMGLGFTLSLLWVSLWREVFGAWRLAGLPVSMKGFDPAVVLIMAPGAFLVLGLSLGFFAMLTGRGKRRAARSAAAAALAEEPLWGPELVEKFRREKAAREEAEGRAQEPGPAAPGAPGAPSGA